MALGFVAENAVLKHQLDRQNALIASVVPGFDGHLVDGELPRVVPGYQLLRTLGDNVVW